MDTVINNKENLNTFELSSVNSEPSLRKCQTPTLRTPLAQMQNQQSLSKSTKKAYYSQVTPVLKTPGTRRGARVKLSNVVYQDPAGVDDVFLNSLVCKKVQDVIANAKKEYEKKLQEKEQIILDLTSKIQCAKQEAENSCEENHLDEEDLQDEVRCYVENIIQKCVHDLQKQQKIEVPSIVITPSSPCAISSAKSTPELVADTSTRNKGADQQPAHISNSEKDCVETQKLNDIHCEVGCPPFRLETRDCGTCAATETCDTTCSPIKTEQYTQYVDTACSPQRSVYKDTHTSMDNITCDVGQQTSVDVCDVWVMSQVEQDSIACSPFTSRHVGENWYMKDQSVSPVCLTQAVDSETMTEKCETPPRHHASVQAVSQLVSVMCSPLPSSCQNSSVMAVPVTCDTGTGMPEVEYRDSAICVKPDTQAISTMTERRVKSTETAMTPVKIQNKDGHRLTAELRKQNPGAVADQLDSMTLTALQIGSMTVTELQQEMARRDCTRQLKTAHALIQELQGELSEYTELADSLALAEKLQSLRDRSRMTMLKPTKMPTLTPAERAKIYREKIKKDSLKMAQYKKKERDRKQIARLKRTEEQIKKEREQSRIRQQKYRDRKKRDGIKMKPVASKILTRKECEKKREYWKIKKRESRQNRNSQQIRRYKERDRDYRYQRNHKNVETTKSRGPRVIPKDPEKFASCIETIVHNATPKKRDLLKSRHLLNTPKSQKKLKFLEKSSSIFKELFAENHSFKKKTARRLALKLKKYRLNSQISTFLGIRESFLSRQLHSTSDIDTRKRRKDATNETEKEVIEEFFQRSDISTNLPTAKRIKKDQTERRILDRPIKDTFKTFKSVHPSSSVSLSTFNRNRPSNVETTKKQSWLGCLCEVCTNVELKLKALSQFADKCGSKLKVRDKFEAINITLCDKGDHTRFHNLECINRSCTNCGADAIVRHFQPLAMHPNANGLVYSKWERVKKMYKGREVTQVMPVSHKGTVTQIVVELCSELDKLASHIFVAAWQQNQFSELLKNVPKSCVVLNMDFSENYTCVSQLEVQSAHWGHNQVTIHPTCAYYKCQEEGCEKTVTEHIIFLSDDKTHGAAAVMKFVHLTNAHLQQNRGLTIEREFQMSDGCAAQYKSKVPFTDISYSYKDFGFPTERHFYGSRHGKGPSDGAGSVVKTTARRAVMGGCCIINDAKDLFEFAKIKLAKEDENHKEHFKRTIILENNINHIRPERSGYCKTLKGTRRVQCVRTVKETVIETRNLSCFCSGCLELDGTACANSAYVKNWIPHELNKQHRGRGRPNNRDGPRTRGGRRGNPRIRGGESGRQRIRGRGRGRPRTRGGPRIRGGGRSRRNEVSRQRTIQDDTDDASESDLELDMSMRLGEESDEDIQDQDSLTSCDDHSSTFEIQTTDFANILHLLDQNTEVEPDVSGVDLVDMEPYSVDQEPTSFDLMPVLMDMEPLSLDQEPLSLGQEPLSLEQEPLSLDQDQEPLSLDQEPLSLDKDHEPLSLDQQSHSLDQDHEPLSLDQEPHSLDQEPHSLDQEPHSLDHGPTEKEPPKSYPEGSYIRVKHGAEVYPAVAQIQEVVTENYKKVKSAADRLMSLRKKTDMERQSVMEQKRANEMEAERCKKEQEDVMDQYENMKKTLATSRTSMVQMDSLYKSTSADLLCATNQVQILSSQLTQIKQAYDDCQLSKSALIQRVEDQEEDSKVAFLEIQGLQASLRQRDVELDRVIKQLTDMKTKYEKKTESLGAEKEQLELLTKNLQRTLDSREEDINHMEDEMYELRECVADQMEKINNLERVSKTTAEDYRTCQAENMELRNGCARMQSSIQELKETVSTGEYELSAAKQQASRMLQKQEDLLDDCAVCVQDLATRMTTLLTDLRNKVGRGSSSKTQTQHKEEKKKADHGRKSFVSQIFLAAGQDSPSNCDNPDLSDGSPAITDSSGDNLSGVYPLSSDTETAEASPATVSRSKLGFSSTSAFAPVRSGSSAINAQPGPLNCEDAVTKDQPELLNQLQTVDDHFCEIVRLANIIEKASRLSIEDLKTENDDLMNHIEQLENVQQEFESSAQLKDQELSISRETIHKMEKQLATMEENLSRFYDQDLTIRNMKSELTKLKTQVRTLEGEKGVLTSQIKALSQNTGQTVSEGSVMDVLQLKMKNQKLRDQMVKKDEYYEELSSKASRRMKVLEENWKRAEAEVYKFDELVQLISESLGKREDLLSQNSDLRSLLKVINGQKVLPSEETQAKPLKSIKTVI